MKASSTAPREEPIPRRLSPKARYFVYQALVFRDGELCHGCQGEPPLVPLDVDHLDNDPENWDVANLQLLCRSCNVGKENARRARLHSIPKLPSSDYIQSAGVGTTERERDADSPTARIIREVVDYDTGSAEMRANHRFMVRYREWVVAMVREQGHLLKEDAVNSGAEIVGCTPITAARYLAMLTSKAGPLMEARDMLKTAVIVPRERPKKPVPPPPPPQTQGVEHEDEGLGTPPAETGLPVQNPKGSSPKLEEQSQAEEAPNIAEALLPYITQVATRCPTCRSTSRWLAPGRSFDGTCPICGPFRARPSFQLAGKADAQA